MQLRAAVLPSRQRARPPTQLLPHAQVVANFNVHCSHFDRVMAARSAAMRRLSASIESMDTSSWLSSVCASGCSSGAGGKAGGAGAGGGHELHSSQGLAAAGALEELLSQANQLDCLMQYFSHL